VAGDAGRTFPSEDAERLAEILAELRDNPDRIEEMRKNCQPQVNRFRPENVVPEIENQYNKVLAAT
jgi:glycosyltransferase involved in cell wall biosynthesis